MPGRHWPLCFTMTSDSTASTQSESSDQAMLRAHELFCERDDRVLFEDLSFALETGQVLQVQGSNGSGKTTLMRVLCGLNDGYQGDIFWFGEPINEQLEPFYSSLLYIGHRAGVNKVLTPLENLRWTTSLHSKIDDSLLLEALAEMGLRGFEESPCYTLSAGQAQRVSLTRLLISPAKLWVLDEPFTTIDTKGVGYLEQLLAEHASNGGCVLVTTHHKLEVPGLSYLSLG